MEAYRFGRKDPCNPIKGGFVREEGDDAGHIGEYLFQVITPINFAFGGYYFR